MGAVKWFAYNLEVLGSSPEKGVSVFGDSEQRYSSSALDPLASAIYVKILGLRCVIVRSLNVFNS